MNPDLQAIYDKVQQYLRSKAIATPNPALVWAADEAELFEDILVELFKAGNIDVSNFEPYDPAKEYSNGQPDNKPDYVSFSTSGISNVYEYIYPTPDTGVAPTTTSHWKIVSSGQFNHIQNTDLGTRNNWYTVQLQSQNQDIDGKTGIILNGGQGSGLDIAIANIWDAIAETMALKVCYGYTGTGADVWEDIGGRKTLPYRFITDVDLVADSFTLTEAERGYTLLISTTDPCIIYMPEGLDGYEVYLIQTSATFTLVGLGGGTLSEISNNYESHGIGWAIRAYCYENTWNIIHLNSNSDSSSILKTGTVVDFAAKETEFGTEATPETGNITANLTGAAVGHMAFMTHNSGTEPTFSSEFHKIAGSGDYVLGVKNYIYFDYRSATRINYSITQ